MLGLSVLVAALMALAIAGTVSAAGSLGPNPLAGDGISDGSSLESPNGPCGDCVCSDCVPDPNLYLGRGPHGFHKGK